MLHRTGGGEHLCGGILIASDAVLTAAHCVDYRASQEAIINPDLHIGGNNRNDPVQIRKTVRAIPHPKWTGTQREGNNLVILKLNETTCAIPATFLGAKGAQGQEGSMFLAYGRTSDGSSFPNVLQGTTLSTLKTRTCNRRYDPQPKVRRNELCARGQTTVGLCTGDDGSPLVIQPSRRIRADILVGIASYATAACTDTEGVSVFMDIYKYRKWINKTLESDEFKEA